MGYYKKHVAVPLPEPAALADGAWVLDEADTDYSSLTVTKRADDTAGKISTGAITATAGGTLTLGFCLDSVVPSLGYGVFSSSTPTDGLRRMPFGFGVACAKVQGDTGGGGTTSLTLGTASATTAGAAAVKATAALAFTGVGVDGNTFTVNDKTYTLKTALSVKATATLDFAGPGVDTQTFTVNDQTYTLQTVLTDTPGNILIGADQTETCTNIVSAIMGTAGAGTTYGTGTVAPTGVDTAVRVADTVVFTATTAGTAANSFATTETCVAASFTNGATMTGGVDEAADTVLIGADQTATCNNIVSMIMGTAGAGTTYGTGSTAPTGVDTAVRASTTVTFTATTAGTAANAFASTETCTNASFTNGATFTGGAAATTRVITGSEEFTTTGPVTATTATLLSALTQLTGTLDNGLDTISLGGKTPNNTNWSGTYTYATGDTLGTLCTRIAALINAVQASSVTCTITAGKIVITDVASGVSSTTLATLTFNDIAAGTYLSAMRIDKVTASGTTLSRTTVGTATGGPWFVGATSATPTAIPITFTPTLVEGGSLELVQVWTVAPSDTVELEVHAIPGSHYLLLDLENLIR